MDKNRDMSITGRRTKNIESVAAVVKDIKEQ